MTHVRHLPNESLMGAADRPATDVTYQVLDALDAERASSIALRSYDCAQTTNDSAAGAQHFRKYASGDEIAARIQKGSLFLVAILGDQDVGVAEIRDAGHLGMLFVLSDHQRRGVGQRLCEIAISTFEQRAGRSVVITVNSAPGAVGFYEKIGFTVVGAAEERNGIRFVPMRRTAKV